MNQLRRYFASLIENDRWIKNIFKYKGEEKMKTKLEKDAEIDLISEINQLKKEFRAFKRRLSVIANILIPGAGFLISGKSYLKGVIVFISYYAYIFIFIPPALSGGLLSTLALFIPALIINLYSTTLVASFKD